MRRMLLVLLLCGLGPARAGVPAPSRDHPEPMTGPHASLEALCQAALGAKRGACLTVLSDPPGYMARDDDDSKELPRHEPGRTYLPREQLQPPFMHVQIVLAKREDGCAPVLAVRTERGWFARDLDQSGSCERGGLSRGGDPGGEEWSYRAQPALSQADLLGAGGPQLLFRSRKVWGYKDLREGKLVTVGHLNGRALKEPELVPYRQTEKVLETTTVCGVGPSQAPSCVALPSYGRQRRGPCRANGPGGCSPLNIVREWALKLAPGPKGALLVTGPEGVPPEAKVWLGTVPLRFP